MSRLFNKSHQSHRLSATALAVMAACAFPASALYAQALPTGGTVVGGQATISQPTATSMLINQSTQKAALDWTSFSIGAGNSVVFQQPNVSSIALNRVIGNDASSIFGSLSANGQVFLVNPSGVLFAPGASVNVGGLVASTLDISAADFMNGNYSFSSNGSAGSVINQGSIFAPGGYVALLGPNVSNEGLISARLGSVALAAGNQVSLDMAGDGLISVRVDQAALNASVINKGSIHADGGNVLLTARSANALLDTVINTSGVIRANSIAERDGKIYLDGGTAGVTSVSGTLSASGLGAGEKGGGVTVLGQYVGLFDGANINVSGDAGGGTVLVGGNFQGKGPEANALRTYVAAGASISADAVTSGNGGKVIIWADDITRFYGSISVRGGSLSGDGGFVEVSGKYYLEFNGPVDASATNGKLGTLLLDPMNIVVDDVGGSVVYNGSVNNQFGNNAGATTTITADSINTQATVLLQATNDITIIDAISLTTDGASFTAQAGNNINLFNNITTQGGAISLTANDTSVGSAPTGIGSITKGVGVGNLTTTGVAGSMAGGDVTLTVAAGSGTISVGNITTSGFSVAPANQGGDVTITTAQGNIVTGTITTTGYPLSGDVSITVSGGTGSINVTGAIDTSAPGAPPASANVGGAGGTVNLTTNDGNITTSTIVTSGGGGGVAVGNAPGLAGGDSGGVGILIVSPGATRTISVGAISAVGGAGSEGDPVNSNTDQNGGAGGAGGTVSIIADSGLGASLIFTVAGINTSGGGGGTAADAGIGGLGGQGGSVNIELAAGGVAMGTAPVVTSGGMGGQDDTGTNGTGGAAGTIDIATSGVLGDIAVNALTSVGGAVGTGGTGGAAGAAAAITLTAGKDITLGSPINAGNSTVGLNFGQAGTSGILTIFASATLAAGTVNATGGGGSADTIAITRDVATLTLIDTSLAMTGLTTINLSSVETANLTGGAGANEFVVSGWMGDGTLTGGGGSDKVTAVNDVNFTLTDTTLGRSGLPDLTLSGIGTADLTGDAAANMFTVSSWTGTANLDGAASADIFIVNASAGAGIVNVADADGANTLTVNGTAGADTFTLSAPSGTTSRVVLTGGSTVNSTDAQIATLTVDGGAGGDSFTVSALTRTATLTGGTETDTVIAVNDVADFGLTNTSLTRTGLGVITLSGVETANLTGIGSANNFTVSGWTGNGTLTGAGGTDIVTASKDVDFTLTNTSLSSTDGMSLTLATIETANLTGGNGNNTFTVSGWAGGGTLTGGAGTDAVTAVKDSTFTLSDTLLTATGGMSLTLASIETANLTGGASANTFTVSSWSAGTANLDGADSADIFIVNAAGAGTVNVSDALGANTLTVNGTAGADAFTLSAQSVTTSRVVLAGGSAVDFTDAQIATLTVDGGAGGDSFTVSALTRTATLTGSGADTVIATNDLDFGLSNTSLTRGALGAITLSGIETANLTGGAAINTFTVSSWTGTANLDGAAGNDIFNVTASGSGAVNVTGGADTDTVNVSVAGTIGLSGSTITNGQTITSVGTVEIVNVTGGAGVDTFTLGSAFAANLYGGASEDVFALATHTLTGVIDGQVDGGSISGIADPNLTGLGTLIGFKGTTTQVFGGYDNITGLTGTGTLSGLNADSTWTIDGLNSGTYVETASTRSLAFSGFTSIAGGLAPDTYTGAGGSLDGDITDAGGITKLNGTLTIGSATFTDGVVLETSTTIVSTGPITFNSTVNAMTAGIEFLDITSGGDITFNGNVGTSTNLSSLITDSTGVTTLNGSVYTRGAQSYTGSLVRLGGDQFYWTNANSANGSFTINGPTEIQASITSGTFVSTGTGNVTFDGTVDGPGALTVYSSGLVDFKNDIGQIAALDSLWVQSSSTPGTLKLPANISTDANAGNIRFGQVFFTDIIGFNNAPSPTGVTFNAGPDQYVYLFGDPSNRGNDLGGTPVNVSGGFFTLIHDTAAQTEIGPDGILLANHSVFGNSHIFLNVNQFKPFDPMGAALSSFSALSTPLGPRLDASNVNFNIRTDYSVTAVTPQTSGPLDGSVVNFINVGLFDMGPLLQTLTVVTPLTPTPVGPIDFTQNGDQAYNFYFTGTLPAQSAFADSYTDPQGNVVPVNGGGAAYHNVVLLFNGTSNVNVFSAGVSPALGSAISAAQQAAAQAAQEEAKKSFGTDSVAQQIVFSFVGDVGVSPPMNHRILLNGIRTPFCFEDSRDNQACK